jgi:CubicO group peptidase (beta-lactamase class C family)
MNERVIRAYLETVPEQNIAGYDLALFQHGKEVFGQMGGSPEFEAKKPITKETKYRLYSSTKVITCTAALMLLERGKFLLSDPVEKFFPEFKTLSYTSKDENGKTETKKCERKMTIKDLFTMSSGLTYEFVPDLIKAGENTGNISTRQLSEILAANPLAYEPGTALAMDSHMMCLQQLFQNC